MAANPGDGVELWWMEVREGDDDGESAGEGTSISLRMVALPWYPSSKYFQTMGLSPISSRRSCRSNRCNATGSVLKQRVGRENTLRCTVALLATGTTGKLWGTLARIFMADTIAAIACIQTAHPKIQLANSLVHPGQTHLSKY